MIFWTVSALILLRGSLGLFSLENLSKLLTEGLLILWLLIELARQPIMFIRQGFKSTLVYIFWIFVVAAYHSEFVEIYLYVRYTLIGLLVVHTIYGLAYGQHFERLFLRSIDWIVVSQIIASIISFVFLGRLERIVGTMSISGGSLATVWPLTFAPYYYFRYILSGKKSYILIVLGLVFMGFVSGKRAVYFLIPLSIIIISFLFRRTAVRKDKLSPFRRLISLSILFIGLLAGIAGTESLSQSNGFSFKSIGSALSYVEEYSTAESVIDGNTIGRTSSTRTAFKSLLNGSGAIFGNGLGVLKGEIGYSAYGIGYGLTGLLRESISLGVIGGWAYLSIYFSFLMGLWRMRIRIHLESQDSDRVLIWYLSISGLIAMLVTIIGYSRVFSQSFTPLFFIMIAVGISFKREF